MIRNALFSICAAAIAAMIAAGIIGIWMNDSRWGGTAILMFCLAFISGLVASFTEGK